jgi:hypothetical protein
VYSARQVILCIFAFFSYVDQQELLASLKSGFYVVNTHFVNAALRVLYYLQKSRIVLMCHERLDLKDSSEHTL